MYRELSATSKREFNPPRPAGLASDAGAVYRPPRPTRAVPGGRSASQRSRGRIRRCRPGRQCRGRGRTAAFPARGSGHLTRPTTRASTRFRRASRDEARWGIRTQKPWCRKGQKVSATAVPRATARRQHASFEPTTLSHRVVFLMGVYGEHEGHTGRARQPEGHGDQWQRPALPAGGDTACRLVRHRACGGRPGAAPPTPVMRESVTSTKTAGNGP